jgi:hypothetical protein
MLSQALKLLHAYRRQNRHGEDNRRVADGYANAHVNS